MTEQVPSEAGRIQDPAKAEEMAYAEKPHREDALELDKLAERAMNVLGDLETERDQNAGFSGQQAQVEAQMRVSGQKAHIHNLEAAQQHSNVLANHAAEMAARNYDSGQPAS